MYRKTKKREPLYICKAVTSRNTVNNVPLDSETLRERKNYSPVNLAVV